jgi:dTDP-4-dehydrorhamnose reductase
MKVLVTGGDGRLARALQAASDEVVALGRAKLDVTRRGDIARALARTGCSVVLNTAGVTSVDAAELAPEAAFLANAVGPGLLADACAEHGIALLHISTDYVFGAPTARPWRETDAVSPVNAYGRGKAEGEVRVLAAGPTGHVVRVAWLFGDEQDFIANALRQGRRGPVRVAHDQIGSPTPLRPLVERLLTLCRRLALADRSIPSRLHLAGSPPVSRADWVASAFAVLRARGIEPPPLVRTPMASFPAAAVRPRFSALDTTLAETLFAGPMDWKASLTDDLRDGGPYAAILALPFSPGVRSGKD